MFCHDGHPYGWFLVLNEMFWCCTEKVTVAWHYKKQQKHNNDKNS